MIKLSCSCRFGTTSTFPHSHNGNTQRMSQVLLRPQVQKELIHICPHTFMLTANSDGLDQRIIILDNTDTSHLDSSIFSFLPFLLQSQR